MGIKGGSYRVERDGVVKIKATSVSDYSVFSILFTTGE